MSKTRLEAFTDAIIAIIMTVLVLELVRPDSDSLQSFIDLLPHLGVYLVSFFILAIYWVNHHHLFQSIKKINGKVLWINISFLFVLSLIPIFFKLGINISQFIYSRTRLCHYLFLWKLHLPSINKGIIKN